MASSSLSVVQALRLAASDQSPEKLHQDQFLVMIQPRVLTVARSIIHNDSLADDIRQIACGKILKNLKSCLATTDQSAWAWIDQIARNTVLDINRSETRRHQREKNQIEQVDHLFSNSSLTQRPDEVTLIRQALNELPDNQQRVLQLRYLEGADLPSTATHLQCSVATVKRLQRRALDHLKQYVGALSVLSLTAALTDLKAQTYSESNRSASTTAKPNGKTVFPVRIVTFASVVALITTSGFLSHAHLNEAVHTPTPSRTNQQTTDHFQQTNGRWVEADLDLKKQNQWKVSQTVNTQSSQIKFHNGEWHITLKEGITTNGGYQMRIRYPVDFTKTPFRLSFTAHGPSSTNKVVAFGGYQGPTASLTTFDENGERTLSKLAKSGRCIFIGNDPDTIQRLTANYAPHRTFPNWQGDLPISASIEFHEDHWRDSMTSGPYSPDIAPPDAATLVLSVRWHAQASPCTVIISNVVVERWIQNRDL